MQHMQGSIKVPLLARLFYARVAYAVYGEDEAGMETVGWTAMAREWWQTQDNPGASFGLPKPEDMKGRHGIPGTISKNVAILEHLPQDAISCSDAWGLVRSIQRHCWSFIRTHGSGLRVKMFVFTPRASAIQLMWFWEIYTCSTNFSRLEQSLQRRSTMRLFWACTAFCCRWFAVKVTRPRLKSMVHIVSTMTSAPSR